MRVLRITPLWDWRAHPNATGLADPGEGVGGHAAQAVRVALALADEGIEQLVLAPRAAGGPRRDELRPGLMVAGVGRAGVGGVHRRNTAWLAGVLAALPRARRDIDVVHLHASGIVEPLWAALAAGLAVPAPLVVTLHHSAQLTYVPQSRRDAAVQVVTRGAERAVIARASTLTLTRRAADRLGGEVMPDCLDVAAFAIAAAGADAFRARHGVPSGVPLAAYVGRISAEKGWRDLVALADGIPGLHVVACGDGPELAELRTLASDRLHVAGPVPSATAAAAMAAADVVVLPSRFEELGSVLLEAMAVGTPSVAYDVGGVAEAIVPGVTGLLVPAGAPSALVDGVRRVLDDADLQARAAGAGPRLAREHYDHHVIARRLRGVYERVANASTSRT